jgi:hypothetical protein
MLAVLMDDATQAGVIVAAILERPTCLICVTAKAGMTSLDVVRTIERIGQTLVVTIEQGGRCRVCWSTLGPVYSLGR